jgi:hypothetical protein
MSENDDFIVQSRDLVEVGVCFAGQRRWWGDQGWDIREFVRDGILASKLEATGDAVALRAVRMIKERRDV